MTLAALVDSVTPTTRPPVMRRPGPRVRGHDVCLARARRGHQHGYGGPRGEEPGGHLGLVRAEARARQGHVRRVRRGELGHLAARLGQ